MTIDGVNNKQDTNKSSFKSENRKQTPSTSVASSQIEKTDYPAAISKTSSAELSRTEEREIIRSEQAAFYEASALAQTIKSGSENTEARAAHNKVSPDTVQKLVASG